MGQCTNRTTIFVENNSFKCERKRVCVHHATRLRSSRTRLRGTHYCRKLLLLFSPLTPSLVTDINLGHASYLGEVYCRFPGRSLLFISSTNTRLMFSKRPYPAVPGMETDAKRAFVPFRKVIDKGKCLVFHYHSFPLFPPGRPTLGSF